MQLAGVVEMNAQEIDREGWWRYVHIIMSRLLFQFNVPVYSSPASPQPVSLVAGWDAVTAYRNIRRAVIISAP